MKVEKNKPWDGMTPEECGRKDAQEATTAVRHLLTKPIEAKPAATQEEVNDLLRDMRVQVRWDTEAHMPIPLYERMKGIIVAMPNVQPVGANEPDEIARLKDIISDWEAVSEQHKCLVRELDVALNGEDGAAQQASLCDIVAQVKHQNRGSEPLAEEDKAEAVEAMQVALYQRENRDALNRPLAWEQATGTPRRQAKHRARCALNALLERFTLTRKP